MKRMVIGAVCVSALVLLPPPSTEATHRMRRWVPQNFAGVATLPTSIRWSWDAVLSQPVTSYELLDSNNQIVAVIPGPGKTPVTFTENGLAPETSYTRHVVAVNGTQVSPPSNSATVNTAHALVDFASDVQGDEVTKEIPDVSDIRTLTDADLEKAIRDLFTALGVPITDDQVKADIKEIRTKGEFAITFSMIRSGITSFLPKSRKIVKREDGKAIGTIIGKKADKITKDHEKTHRTINVMLLNDGFLTSFFNTIVAGTDLGVDDMSELVLTKLNFLDAECNDEFDKLFNAAPNADLPKLNQVALGETLASLKRDVVDQVFQIKFKAEMTKLGRKLTKDEAAAVVAATDDVVKKLGATITSFGKLEELDKERKNDFKKFIDKVLKL